MFGKLFLLFTVLPFLELFVLIKIGERIGSATTVTLVILTGVVGAALARSEGLRVLRAWQASIAKGQVPTAAVINGALVMLGCALLISPGVITDIIALLLFLPFTRRIAARIVALRVQGAIERGAIRVASARAAQYGPARHDGPDTIEPSRPQVIDVEGEPVEATRKPGSCR
jgi:UPF0716 protein FxsA